MRGLLAGTALVWMGCHDKLPQTRRFKPQKSIFSILELGVGNQREAGWLLRSPPCPGSGRLVFPGPPVAFPRVYVSYSCLLKGHGSGLFCWHYIPGTLHPSDLTDLISSLKTPFLIQSRSGVLGMGLRRMLFGGHNSTLGSHHALLVWSGRTRVNEGQTSG